MSVIQSAVTSMTILHTEHNDELYLDAIGTVSEDGRERDEEMKNKSEEIAEFCCAILQLLPSPASDKPVILTRRTFVPEDTTARVTSSDEQRGNSDFQDQTAPLEPKVRTTTTQHPRHEAVLLVENAIRSSVTVKAEAMVEKKLSVSAVDLAETRLNDAESFTLMPRQLPPEQKAAQVNLILNTEYVATHQPFQSVLVMDHIAPSESNHKNLKLDIQGNALFLQYPLTDKLSANITLSQTIIAPFSHDPRINTLLTQPDVLPYSGGAWTLNRTSQEYCRYNHPLMDNIKKKDYLERSENEDGHTRQ